MHLKSIIKLNNNIEGGGNEEELKIIQQSNNYNFFFFFCSNNYKYLVFMIGHVQRRATNAHIKKSELIQVEKRKRGKGISKITLVEVIKKGNFN